MAGLVVFTIFAGAGCALLIYFMFALWRDSRKPRNRSRVEIRELPHAAEKGKLLHFYRSERTVGEAAKAMRTR